MLAVLCRGIRIAATERSKPEVPAGDPSREITIFKAVIRQILARERRTSPPDRKGKETNNPRRRNFWQHELPLVTGTD